MDDLPIVEATNERMIFLVRSAKHPKVRYRTDLLANKGAGWCQCVDFSTRRQPAIDLNEPHGTRVTMCRHVILARSYFLNGLLKRMARAEDNPLR